MDFPAVRRNINARLKPVFYSMAIHGRETGHG
jgi:hypothetical protein